MYDCANRFVTASYHDRGLGSQNNLLYEKRYIPMNSFENFTGVGHKCKETLTEVHEVLGSVRLAELQDDPHNHRFDGITGEEIVVPGGHIHKFETRTDFYENHYHRICVKTGPPILVGKGANARHVHFLDDMTEMADNHNHEFIASTLIFNPIGE